jgi:hypothetical protein
MASTGRGGVSKKKIGMVLYPNGTPGLLPVYILDILQDLGDLGYGSLGRARGEQ